jgi:hypothetical protein
MLGLDWVGVRGKTAVTVSRVISSSASTGEVLGFRAVLGVAGEVLDGPAGGLAALELLVTRLGGCGSAALSLALLARGVLGGVVAGGLSTAMVDCAPLDLAARPVLVAEVVSVTPSVVLESGVALALPWDFARVGFAGFNFNFNDWRPRWPLDMLLVCAACATVRSWFPLPVISVALSNISMWILGRSSDGNFRFPMMLIFASTAGTSGSSEDC